jgi:hypothetical protein
MARGAPPVPLLPFEWEHRIERWFAYPWQDAKAAARLTTTLTRFVMPQDVVPAAPLPDLDLDPYRTTTAVVQPGWSGGGVVHARGMDIDVALRLVDDYVADMSIEHYDQYATRHVEPYDTGATRRYWACAGVIALVARWGTEATSAWRKTAEYEQRRWATAAATVAQGARIVQRAMTGVAGEEMACNVLLTQCATPIVWAFDRQIDEPDLRKISEIIVESRVADATRGRTDVDPDLLYAFAAAWDIDEFDAAYRLLEA